MAGGGGGQAGLTGPAAQLPPGTGEGGSGGLDGVDGGPGQGQVTGGGGARDAVGGAAGVDSDDLQTATEGSVHEGGQGGGGPAPAHNGGGGGGGGLAGGGGGAAGHDLGEISEAGGGGGGGSSLAPAGGNVADGEHVGDGRIELTFKPDGAPDPGPAVAATSSCNGTAPTLTVTVDNSQGAAPLAGDVVIGDDVIVADLLVPEQSVAERQVVYAAGITGDTIALVASDSDLVLASAPFTALRPSCTVASPADPVVARPTFTG